MQTLNVIGPGRAGAALAMLFSRRGVFEIRDVLSGSPESARAAVDRIGSGTAVGRMDAMRRADVWMVTPPDREIVPCAVRLAASGRLRAGDVVFHCSGSMPASVLAPLAAAGASIASVHPVKSIADSAAAARSFEGTYCAAEGDAEALALLEPAFAGIGATVIGIDPDSKSIYHAGAVLVCNYLTALIAAGIRCYGKAGVDRRTALRVIEPIVRETVDNVFSMGPARALTGPVARGDAAVVERQLRELGAWDPDIGELYRQLGRMALELARERGEIAPEAIEAVARALAAPPSGAATPAVARD